VAAEQVCRTDSTVGFIVFGDGPERANIERQIGAIGLAGRFILAGFHADLAGFLPHLDLAVLPSFTEGLPVVLLEAFAAGVPAVATAVGGTPEVLDDGRSGFLVPPGDPSALAVRIVEVLSEGERRCAMGQHGRERVRRDFTFAVQSERYQELFQTLACPRRRRDNTARELVAT
jgi:glycosyltransferase involved in cell wall biosynthesis